MYTCLTVIYADLTIPGTLPKHTVILYIEPAHDSTKDERKQLFTVKYGHTLPRGCA